MIQKNCITRFPPRFVTTAAIYDEWHNVAALDVVALRLRTPPRRPRLYKKLQNTQANFDVSTEWRVKKCDSFRCVPNTHKTLCPVTDLWFHIDSEQYYCQFIPTFECKWLHVQLLRSQFHQIQGTHKRMVRFKKLPRNLFLTLHGHNVHRQQRQMSKFLMRYQQFVSRAYCGAAGPVSKMAS